MGGNRLYERLLHGCSLEIVIMHRLPSLLQLKEIGEGHRADTVLSPLFEDFNFHLLVFVLHVWV